MAIPHRASQVTDNVPLSIGIATLQPGTNTNHEDLIRYADQALYACKMNGKNQVYPARKIFLNNVKSIQTDRCWFYAPSNATRRQNEKYRSDRLSLIRKEAAAANADSTRRAESANPSRALGTDLIPDLRKHPISVLPTLPSLVGKVDHRHPPNTDP